MEEEEGEEASTLTLADIEADDGHGAMIGGPRGICTHGDVAGKAFRAFMLRDAARFPRSRGDSQLGVSNSKSIESPKASPSWLSCMFQDPVTCRPD